MKRSDLLVAMALAILLHGLLFAMSEVFSSAKVVYKRGDSSIALLLLPSVASEAAAPPKAPEPPKEKPKPVEPTKPKPQPPKPPEKPQKLPQVAEVPLPEYPPIDELLPWFEPDPPPPPVKESKPHPPQPPKQEDVKKPLPQVAEPPKFHHPHEEARPAEKPSPPSKEVEADLREKGVTTKASVAALERPRYPASCRRLGHEGDCIYEFTVGPDGKCTDLLLLKSAGCPDLDEAAREALVNANFIPAKRLGVAVSSRKRLIFRFRLEEAE